MNNLFELFDPTISFMGFMSISWLLGSINMLMLLPYTPWTIMSNNKYIILCMMKYLLKEFNSIMNNLYSPGVLTLSMSLFMMLLFMNMSGLLPYYFSISSHMVFSFSMAIPMWIGHIVYSWSKQINYMLTHMVPSGTPFMLIFFMVWIELLSSIIRPITLSIRLMANIMAGHLLLTLLSSCSIFWIYLPMVMMGLSLLIMLELGVSMIQAYVFSVLSTLYVKEIYTYKIILNN